VLVSLPPEFQNLLRNIDHTFSANDSVANTLIGEAREKHGKDDPLVRAVEKLFAIASALIGKVR
jgi:hypothetical protein